MGLLTAAWNFWRYGTSGVINTMAIYGILTVIVFGITYFGGSKVK